MVLQTRLFRFFSAFLWNARYQIQYIIEHFRRYVTERLLNTKGSGFLGFSMVCTCICKNIDSLGKMRLYMIIRLKKCSCSMADGFQAHAELTI